MISDCVYPGIDFSFGDFSGGKANNVQECESRCKDHSECKRWTFWMPDEFGNCYLKKQDSNLYAEFCLWCISGFQNSNLDVCGDNGKINRHVAYSS